MRGHLWSSLAALGGIAYLMALAAWAAPSSGADERRAQTGASIKAEFLYKFLGYVEWRADVFAQPSSPVVIGVLGADDIVGALRMLVGARKVGERRIEVRRASPGRTARRMSTCCSSAVRELSRVPKLADAAQRRGVLLVTDRGASTREARSTSS